MRFAPIMILTSAAEFVTTRNPMPFPVTPRAVYQRNPLTDVGAHFRFPPILAIGAGPPAVFQERIRAEYPLYARQGLQPNLPREIAGFLRQLQIQGALEGASYHQFSTADKQQTIILNPETLSVLSKTYQRWETFAESVNRARAALEEVYQPAFYTRTGLKYVDVIDREMLGLQNEPWTNLIRDKLVGLLSATELGDEVTEHVTTTSVLVRDVPGGVAKLQFGLQRRVQPGSAIAAQTVFVMNADFSTNQQTAPANVENILVRFNRVAGNFFRWAISERLRDALQPHPVGG